MVEFALISTMLITLLLVICEAGFLFYVQGTLAGAAREAAREFAITNNQVEASKLALKAAPGTGLATGEISYSPGTCAIGSSVTVTILHKQGSLTGIAGFFKTPITIRSTGTMRCNG